MIYQNNTAPVPRDRKGDEYPLVILAIDAMVVGANATGNISCEANLKLGLGARARAGLYIVVRVVGIRGICILKLYHKCDFMVPPWTVGGAGAYAGALDEGGCIINGCCVDPMHSSRVWV